jgi:uncharacterized damage-inducible protein DinB
MRPPVTFDPLTILLRHNHWATRRVLELCRRLSPAQFQQRFDIGPGSLHDTLIHIVDCMRWWADDVSGRPRRASLAPARRAFSPDEVYHWLDEIHAEFEGLVEKQRRDLAGTVDVTLGDRRFTFTRGVAFTHALVHGTHHRAQCLNMLRRLNVPGLSDRLPDLDVNDWQYEMECKP